ncbi:MAG: UDP-N-acetylglucosamine 2-epimerase (non-hydrolyzing) [Gemmatimonadota bacterium]|nr:UDP-N-acetylglucosamine 2-epimerase (non-hydrolyzing) [Gemmatimonadota bacterium]
MRILTVLGARPQFIKAAPVSVALAGAGHEERIIHTGQHYDADMSDVFFEELPIPVPHRNLGVGSAPGGVQTGGMLEALEPVLEDERPDYVLVYGDTNSTLAGALAAVKLGIPVAHIEAGLRSFNRAMPEEINRVVADHCSDLLLCPTEVAVANLADEGITDRARLVGDTMLDVQRSQLEAASRREILEKLGLEPRGYSLATAHRAYTVDDRERLASLLGALDSLSRPVVMPLHPRTRNRMDAFGLPEPKGSLRLIDPVGYLDMLQLEANAHRILTDSGGIQKEAYWLEVPCITMRPETEWPETVEQGWNRLVDVDPEAIRAAAEADDWPEDPPPPLFGDGRAAARIVEQLEDAPEPRAARIRT